jgi:diacylglycerol kinase family enzyme
MELAPFPYGRLPGLHRAISLHPSRCVLLCAAEYNHSAGGKPSGPGATVARRAARGRVRNDPTRPVFPQCMAATSIDPIERLEAALRVGAAVPSKRMLVMVNPYATTVSDRLKNLVVYALRGSFQVDAIDTEARNHATELCREAAQQGYDVVVAFGGDGTVNEAANGLAGSGTALSCLPGGRTNVYCRMLGIPTDVVDATEHLLGLADDWRPRRVDLGRVNARHFLFSAGVGLDASVVKRVDAHPRLKARAGEWYYTLTGIGTFNRRYLVHPPRMAVQLGEQRVEGVTTIVQNAAPYTYFGNRPVEIGAGAALDSGDLSGVVLRRTSPIDIPTVSWRALSRRARIARHRQVTAFNGRTSLLVSSLDDRPLPVQIDGDYIGEVGEAAFEVTPRGILVVA